MDQLPNFFKPNFHCANVLTLLVTAVTLITANSVDASFIEYPLNTSLTIIDSKPSSYKDRRVSSSSSTSNSSPSSSSSPSSPSSSSSSHTVNFHVESLPEISSIDPFEPSPGEQVFETSQADILHYFTNDSMVNQPAKLSNSTTTYTTDSSSNNNNNNNNDNNDNVNSNNNNNSSEDFSIVSSAHANTNTIRPLPGLNLNKRILIQEDNPDTNKITNGPNTLPSEDEISAPASPASTDPHNGIGSSLIPTLAFLLSQSYALYLNETSNKHKSENASSTVKSALPNFPHMVSLDQDEDLMSSDSVLSATTSSAGPGTGVASFANWLKNTILGSKWRANKKPDDRSNLQQVNGHNTPYTPPFPPPFHGHPHPGPPGDFVGDGSGGPPPPLHFLPSPEGFPNPYSPDSVLLPPEALQDTGIMYWLNFIEQAANKDQGQNQYHSGPDPGPPYQVHSSQHTRPLRIGEKPASHPISGPGRGAPNSIKDEISSSNIDNLEGSIDEDLGDINSPDDEHRQYKKRPPSSQSDRATGERERAGGIQKPQSSSNSLELYSTSSGHTSSSEDPISTEASAPRCDKFTSSICIDDFEYPEQAIVDEIGKRKELFELMWSDDAPTAGTSTSASSPQSFGLVDGIPAHTEESYTYSSSSPKKVSAGYVCPSEVLYGRPKLAKNMAGEWKVIVNAGDFTQTLRMEKCLNPNSACSYILPHLETRCAQVHSIHRLMVFEKGRGFFVESFKIPTGCTCHIVRSKQGSSSGHKNRVRGGGGNSGGGNFENELNSAAYSLLQQQSSNPNLVGLANQQSLLAALHGLQQKQALIQRLKQATQNSPVGSSSSIPLLDISQAGNQHQYYNLPGKSQSQGPMSSSLWSLLMGASGDGGKHSQDLMNQLGLLAHLKQTYPEIASQINPESLLHPKIHSPRVSSNRNGNKNSIQSLIKNKQHQNLQMQQSMQQQPQQQTLVPQQQQQQQNSPHQIGATIVNPLAMAGGGQVPLVQVIHVPVTGAAVPSHQLTMPMSGPNMGPSLISGVGMSPPLLTAYDSKANASFISNLANGTNGMMNGAYSMKPESEAGVEESEEDEGDEANSSPQNDHSPDDQVEPPVSLYRAVKRNGSVFMEKAHKKTSLGQNSTVSSATDYLANKLKFNHKINFNYHPILEYIPTVTPGSAQNQGLSDTSTPFIPYFPRSSSSQLTSQEKNSPLASVTTTDSSINLLNSHLLGRNH